MSTISSSLNSSQSAINSESSASTTISPQAILTHYLSIRSIVSFASYFAKGQQAAANSGEPPKFRRIGAGTCGIVFEVHGEGKVVKLARAGWEDQLWNDSVMHQRVLEGFKIHAVADCIVPCAYGYVTDECEAFWRTDGQEFPSEHRLPAHCYFSERLLPIPKILRHALIDEYFPELIRERSKLDTANSDCLIRLYLGKRRDLTRQKQARASLRNYPLHLDQMHELNLDINLFASTMADALAVMHWGVGIDAEDVEFVLGSQPALYNKNLLSIELIKVTKPITTHQLNFGQRTIQMFLIDFNRCQDMYIEEGRAMNAIKIKDIAQDLSLTSSERRAASIKQAVSAFFRNDPYFPRPLSDDPRDQDLWRCFEEEYMVRGKKLLGGKDKEIRALPQRFIDGVVEETKIRIKRKREAEERLVRNEYINDENLLT